MDAHDSHLAPGDPELVNNIVNHLKSKGIFDQFRHDCLADVDTKPSYQNLRQRVDGFVTKVLSNETWSPDLNKNQLRNNIRKQIDESGMLAIGVEHVVEQVVTAKMYQVFLPKIEDIVKQYLGLKKANEGNPSDSKNEGQEILNPDQKTEVPVVGNSKVDHRAFDSIAGKPCDVLQDAVSDESSNVRNNLQKDGTNASKLDINLSKTDSLKNLNESSTSHECKEPDVKAHINLQNNDLKSVSVSDGPELKGTIEYKSQDVNCVLDGKNLLQNDVIMKLDKSWIKQREKARQKYDEPKPRSSENLCANYKQVTSASNRPSCSFSESSKGLPEQSKSKHVGNTKSKCSDSPKFKVTADDFEKNQLKTKASVSPKCPGNRIKLDFQEECKLEVKNKESKIHKGKNDTDHARVVVKQESKGKGSKLTSEEKSISSSETSNKQQLIIKYSTTPKKDGRDEKFKQNKKDSKSALMDHGKCKDTSKLPQDATVNSDKKLKSQTNMPNSIGQNADKNKSSLCKFDSKELSNKHLGKNQDKASYKKSKFQTKPEGKPSLKDVEKPVEQSTISKMVKVCNDSVMIDAVAENVNEKLPQKTNEVNSKTNSVRLRKDICNDGKRCNTPPVANLQHKVGMKSKKKLAFTKLGDNKDLVSESSNTTVKLDENSFQCFLSSSDDNIKEQLNEYSGSGKNRERLSSNNIKAQDEEDDDKSDSDWSNVTISSVHTSDLSSYDDRISFSSDDEAEQKTKRMKKSKKKVPLKEVKQIAQEFDGKAKDESDVKDKQEKVVSLSNSKKENRKMSPVVDDVPEAKYSSSEDDMEKQSVSTLFKSCRKVRRKRKLNPKYSSNEYTSIFSSSKTTEIKDAQDVSDSSNHTFSAFKNSCDPHSKVNKDVSLNIGLSTESSFNTKTDISSEKSNNVNLARNNMESLNTTEKHQYTIHGCEYSSSEDFPNPGSDSEEVSDEDSESDDKSSNRKEDSKSTNNSDEESGDNFKWASDSSRNEGALENCFGNNSMSSDSCRDSNEIENQNLLCASTAVDSPENEDLHGKTFKKDQYKSKSNDHSATCASKHLMGDSIDSGNFCMVNEPYFFEPSSLSQSHNVVDQRIAIKSENNCVPKRGRPRKLLPVEVKGQDKTSVTRSTNLRGKRRISVSSEQLDISGRRKRLQINSQERNTIFFSSANGKKRSLRHSTCKSDSWDLTNRPKRRLSEISQSDSQSKIDSSKFYDSSDLYKPRPVISSGTRRSRVQSPC